MADKDKTMTDASSDDIVDLESLIAEDTNADIQRNEETVTDVSEEKTPETEVESKESQNPDDEQQVSAKEEKKEERLPVESIYDSIVTVEEKKKKKKKAKKKEQKDDDVTNNPETVEDNSNQSGPKDDAPSQADVKEERRILRQRRRKRNRIIAFIVAFILLAAIGVGAFYGINAAVDVLDNKEPDTIVVDEPEVFVEEEIPTPVVDMTPETVEELEPEEIIEEPVEEVVEQSDEELLDEMVRTMISEMTLEEKVAGLFIVSPENLTGQNNVTKAGEGTKAALEKYPIGGIIYSKQNIKSADQLKEMIENTVTYNRYPMFVGITEESGSESKLTALKVEKTPSAKELGAEGDSGVVYDTYSKIGSYLAENGFNLDFAPVADVMSNNSRSFSEDPNTVANLVGGAIGGLKEAGIYSCVKNFPGMGYVNGDSTKTLTSTERTKAEMEKSELIPFKIAIEAGTDMIMVGHFAAPAITEDNMPCSMSKAIMTDLLRYEMNYDGVIITDACNVASISQYYSADEVAIKALKAGADMVLLPENFTLACDGVVEAVKDGTIDERRIDDSLARVYKVKYRNTLER